ncbi:MAG: hypothetical protein JXA73_11985 [Acidobacteria bacterium]|nr:hypothetical protein [Acidobacteriota bacterium]
MRSRIADWASIIGCLVTVGTTFGAFFGRLDKIQANYSGSANKLIAFSLAMVITTWSFLFLSLIRLFRKFAESYSDLSLALYFVAGMLGLGIFIAFEILILDILLPTHLNGVPCFLWIGIPALLWLFLGTFAMLASESHTRM